MPNMQTNLFGGIENIVNRVIESTPIDTTITASIALLKNADIGEYKVTYKGDTFSAKSIDPAVIYKKGEEVYVLVPKGDFSASKIILGKAAFNDTVTYADRQTMSNQWKTRGPNWLSNEWYWRNNIGGYRVDNAARGAGIIATKKDEESLITGGIGSPPSWREYLYYRSADTNPEPDEPPLSTMRKNKITRPLAENRPSLDSLKKVDADFQNYSAAFEHIMISAEFETNFSMVHFSGEYGILVECYADNPKFGKEGYLNEPPRIITAFRFSFNDFNGAPYQFNQSSPQRAVFPIPKNILKGLVRVSLFQDDGWNTDIVPIYLQEPGKAPEVSFEPAKGATVVRSRNNITVKNVDIRWCEGIELKDTLFWLKIDAPRGTTLYNAQGNIPANPSLPLEARLFYGSEEVTSKDTCKFIWFRQKYSATMDKVDKVKDKDDLGNTWYSYGGPGWAPVDKIMLPGTDPGNGDPWSEFFGEGVSGINEYSFKDPTWQQTLNIGIKVVPWQWKYKVVCVYNPTPKNIADKILRESRQVILSETEIITNTSSIHDFELPLPMVSNDLTTTYLRTRNNTLPWEERIAYDPQNPNLPDPKKDWWCRWWMETPSGLYEPIPHTGSPRFQKGKTGINDYLHYDAITFKAQIFGNKTPSGTTSQEKVGKSAEWLAPALPNQSLEYNQYEIANIERTVLKSDSFLLLVDWEGITNHSYNSDGSILLESSVENEFPLRAILHWTDTSIMDYSIEWIAPDGKSSLAHHTSYPGGDVVGTGFKMNDSMMYDMWVGSDNIVHYKVRQKYDINKTKNTFTLRISLIDGRVFEYHKEITFVKAGQNGTQGSEWEARIWPTNDVAEVAGGGQIGFERYTEEIRMYPRPLVVNGNFSGTGTLARNDQFQLFLRPFIYKNGKRIEELADRDQYSYKVYWDSRYPNVKNVGPSSPVERVKASNGSFLRFQKFNGRGETYYGRDISAGSTSPNGITDIQAYTDSTDTVGGAAAGLRTYGSLEVQWRGLNTCGKGATISGVQYDFTIKAQVDIYKQEQLISTIFSYWPVDILFTNGRTIDKTTFNPNKIKTNWPQFVLYNPTGYGPETSQEYLRFYYGNKAWNTTDPLPFTATPVNLTSVIQNIKPESTDDKKSWRLYPRPYYFFEECANGSMATNFTTDNGDQGWSSPNPDMSSWASCTYVRPIVYMINLFGNTDINGWDGKSIDLNDERGTIFAPTIGAGYKDPFSNKFSGVIMGIDTSQSKQTYKTVLGGFSQDDIKKNPFMTGLFGYQDGASSFGIMENGTAYFGRADRGGRIIIDGFNAQIYGGLNTSPSTGGRDMDMHNRMRLSFIDFEGVATNPWNNTIGVGETDEAAARKILDTDGHRINTGSWDTSRFNTFFSPDPATSTAAARYSGFGSGRGAGTPAIEIGSYRNYLYTSTGSPISGRTGNDLIKKIGAKESQRLEEQISKLEIPGERKFLVTYDGTLYAMNAFIKGNIVGSNIIAVNFYNNNGSFGVDEFGNLWSGSGYGNFSEVFMDELGKWSINTPNENSPVGVSDILRATDKRWTGMPTNEKSAEIYEDLMGENAGQGPPFFVSSDGRVFCNELHMSGSSSINIGGFHVIGNNNGTNRRGDVFSFGIMHLIGPNGGTENETALEAWGNFYLRGKLTNLGEVYLGSSTEKYTGINTTPASVIANSFNAPLSVKPTSGRTTVDPYPKFPIQMGVWPLYFHLGSDALKDSNSTWVCMSSDLTKLTFAENMHNGYMPAFSLRKGINGTHGPTIIPDVNESGESFLGRHLTWRLDKLAMWSDSIIFTRPAWCGNLSDVQGYTPDQALLYMGWAEVSRWSDKQSDVGVFMIKNVSKTAPNTVIEVSNVLRLSAGRDGTSRGIPQPASYAPVNSVIIDSYQSNTTNRRATMVVSGKMDTFSASAGILMLAAKSSARVGGSFDKKEQIQAFLAMNTLGWETFDLIHDERGKIVEIIPKRQTEDSSGFIWSKARTIAIDANEQMVQVTGNTSTATLRLNRTFSGDPTTLDTPPTGTPVANTGSVMHGLAALSGSAAISIETKVTGWIRLRIGVQGARSFVMTPVELRISNYTPEEQFGIYARFG